MKVEFFAANGENPLDAVFTEPVPDDPTDSRGQSQR